MNSKEYMEKTEQYVLHTYNRFPVVLEKGEGVYLTDADGKEYLDFGAGIAVLDMEIRLIMMHLSIRLIS